MDSHNHLFFNCEYSNQIWNGLKIDARMNTKNNNWKDIISYVEKMPTVNNIWSVLRRLVPAATVYHIWI